MTLRKKILATTIAATTALGLVSCSGGDKETDSNTTTKAAEDTTAAKADDKKDEAKSIPSTPVRVWFMEGSVSEEAQNYLASEFKKKHPDTELSIEIQPWQNIKAKMQTALASKDQSPDIVEIGTSINPLAASGALEDISSMYEELGGKDLIPAFTNGGQIDGKNFSYPMYGGVRGVFYRKDLFEKANIAEPATLTELKDAVIALQAANPDGVDNFSGMYLAGVDFHALESYMYAMGGRYAEKEGDKWVGGLQKPDAMKSLEQMQEIFRDGTRYALDSKAGQKQFQNYFNEGKVGLLIATGNIGEKIDKSLWDEGKVGVMPLPSSTPGEVGATYAGGSNLAIAKNALNKEGAKEAMKIIYSPEFMTLIAESGWVPGNLKYADKVSGAFGPISQTVMEHAVGVPLNLNFAKFYQDNTLSNFWARIAKLEDPAVVAADMDKIMDETLNSK